MSNGSQLPTWVFYLQALTVPIIALAGVWIAAQQREIAAEKLRLDAFDRQYERRVAVYKATRMFLQNVFRGTISDSEINIYGLHTLDAKFLFDDNLYKYLKEILDRVSVWHHAKSKEQSGSSDEKTEFKRIADDNLNWLTQQGDEITGFDVMFTPFLVYKPTRRSLCCRTDRE